MVDAPSGFRVEPLVAVGEIVKQDGGRVGPRDGDLGAGRIEQVRRRQGEKEPIRQQQDQEKEDPEGDILL